MSFEGLEKLIQEGRIQDLDVHFADLMDRLAGGGIREVTLAAALASAATREGHVCLDLIAPIEGIGEAAPDPALWRERLAASPVVGRPGDFRPLILDDGNRLYLYRYWEYQHMLASAVRERAGVFEDFSESPEVQSGMRRLFPGGPADEDPWPRAAAFAALTKPLCVITGGPGTGKTTTVARFLALHLLSRRTGRFRVALAAPTGKAAARLKEAVGLAKRELDLPADVAEAIPAEASTIHRLLGGVPDSPYFRRRKADPLPADLVVVDEASMVDLPLMAKLADALKPGARLILLGDKDQLSSVEAGAVLSDLCGDEAGAVFSKAFIRGFRTAVGRDLGRAASGPSESGLADGLVELRQSHRFGSESGIGELSRAVNRGDAGGALSVLIGGGYPDLVHEPLPSPRALPARIREAVVRGFEGYLKAGDPEESLRRLNAFRVLSPVRQGPYGVAGLNVAIQAVLKNAGLIDPGRTWYPGRPVIVIVNDYNLKLFNGDVGAALPDASGDLRVHFPSTDGRVRSFHPLRLPRHETVFAMTVHKSQGSEFDRVLMVLPDADAPVLTRELIYTGLTRARETVTVMTRAQVFQKAVERRIERSSGLRDLLWGS